MGDMGDIFNTMKQAKKQKRRNNLASSTDLLIEKGVEFESLNDGVHLRINHEDKVINFWPSTGLFMVKGSNKKHRGVHNLLKMIGKE